jgi:hypothetical protein
MQMRMNLLGTKQSWNVIMEEVRSSETSVNFPRLHAVASRKVAPSPLTFPVTQRWIPTRVAVFSPQTQNYYLEIRLNPVLLCMHGSAEWFLTDWQKCTNCSSPPCSTLRLYEYKPSWRVRGPVMRLVNLAVVAVSRQLLIAAARGSNSSQVMWDLWWTNGNRGRFSPNTSASSATHSTDCPTLIIYHSGRVQ